MEVFPVDAQRPMGLETEYAVTTNRLIVPVDHYRNYGPFAPSVTEVCGPVFGAGTSGGYLINGARLYPESHGLIEYATQEIFKISGLLSSHFAGEALVRDIVVRMHGDNAQIQKESMDQSGETHGEHENYMVNARNPVAGVAAEFAVELATRPVISGPGYMRKNKLATDTYEFCLDQRPHDMSGSSLFRIQDVGIHGEKAFFVHRDEHFDGRRQTNRIQAVTGSQNMYAFPIAARLFGGSLVLRMIEQKQFPKELLLENPYQAIRQAAGPDGLTKPLELKDRRHLSALQIQHELAVRKVLFAEAQGVPTDELHIARLVLRITTDFMDGRIEQWRNYVEWVGKSTFIQERTAKHNQDPLGTTAARYAYQWHSLSGKCLADILRQRGEVALFPSQDAIEIAKLTAPDQTRAHARHAILRHLVPEHVQNIDWETINLADDAGMIRMSRAESPEVPPRLESRTGRIDTHAVLAEFKQAA